jgi:hypothetical protein
MPNDPGVRTCTTTEYLLLAVTLCLSCPRMGVMARFWRYPESHDDEEEETYAEAPRPVPAVNDHKRRYRMRLAKLCVYKQAKDKIRDAHCKYVKLRATWIRDSALAML